LSFLFLAFVEPVRAVERGGVSIDSSAQTTAADSIISLVSFTHTVYIYCCLFPLQRWKRWRGGLIYIITMNKLRVVYRLHLGCESR
jgi:hypothetical protein